MKKISASLLILLPLVSGCSSTVALEPAEYANDVACAEVIVRLGDEISGQPRRNTNAQSTAAWGDPTSILLRCGLEPVNVSELPCVTAGDVDWLVDDSNRPNYRFVTFGRTPATEVIVDSDVVSGVSALEELAPLVEYLPASASCTTSVEGEGN
ncbi:MAG: hypothetical protein RIR16_386 [Actinomycetota bacterium]|jgi:hypothetical protein